MSLSALTSTRPPFREGLSPLMPPMPYSQILFSMVSGEGERREKEGEERRGEGGREGETNG